MGAKVSFDTATRIISVTSAPVPVGNDMVVDLDIQADVYSDGKEDWLVTPALRKLKFPLRSVGGDSLPGAKVLGSTFFLDSGWKIRPYEANHRFRVNGNFYSEDGSSPFTDTLGSYRVFLEQTVSSLVDSTVAQLDDLEHITFNNGVWMKVGSGNTGTTAPQGEPQPGSQRVPLDNLADALVVAVNRGFDQLYVEGVWIFDTGDALSNYRLKGINTAKTSVTINPGAVAAGISCSDMHLHGTLDGSTVASNCYIHDLVYIEGTLDMCILEGTIVLAGNEAYMLHCYSGLTTPRIDLANGTTNLNLKNHTGKVVLFSSQTMIAAPTISISVDPGEVIIESSVTLGNIIIDGVGKVTNSAPTTTSVFMDDLVAGQKFKSLHYSVESLRPNHTGFGKVIYWDPYGGSDLNFGATELTATKTFARAHDLATDWGHDIIVCHPGNPTGITIATENISITKNYLFVRGPGKDFKIYPTAVLPSGYLCDITGLGVEVSSIELDGLNAPIGSQGILVSGDFFLLKDVYVEKCDGDGIVVTSKDTRLENVESHHHAGAGVVASGNCTLLQVHKPQIHNNSGDGFRLEGTAHETQIHHGTIHANAGYGVNISVPGVLHTLIKRNTTFSDNTLGKLRDLGTYTGDETTDTNIEIADAVANRVYEGTLTHEEMMRIILASTAGKTEGAGTSTMLFKGADGTTTRITATMDGNNNRTITIVNGAP